MTGGGPHGNKGIILKRPDGTDMSAAEVIVRRRGAFLWLPAFFSNDLVHASWWFTVGSVLTAASGVYPLVQKYGMGQVSDDDLLPSTDYDITWASVIISGLFFTVGSLAFARAFEEPPKRALFYYNKHFQTDELLGAWLFLFGTAPSIPYILVFFLIEPSAFYFFCLCGAIILTLGCALFVKACYPSDKKRDNYILPIFLRINGAQMWAVKHLANDWLAGTWFFLWANGLLTFGSFIMLLVALGLHSDSQIFIWLSGTICCFIFLIGSLYFVAGSYPHAQQFYYAINMNNAESAEDIYGDEMGLLNSAENAQQDNAALNSSESRRIYRIIYNQPLPPPVIRKSAEPRFVFSRNIDTRRDSMDSTLEKSDLVVDNDSLIDVLHNIHPTLNSNHGIPPQYNDSVDGPKIASTNDTIDKRLDASLLHTIHLSSSASQPSDLNTLPVRRLSSASMVDHNELDRLVAVIESNIHNQVENRDDDDDEDEGGEEDRVIERSIHALHTISSMTMSSESVKLHPVIPRTVAATTAVPIPPLQSAESTSLQPSYPKDPTHPKDVIDRSQSHKKDSYVIVGANVKATNSPDEEDEEEAHDDRL